METAAWSLYGNIANRVRTEMLGLPAQTRQESQAERREMTIIHGYSPHVVPHPADWPTQLESRLERCVDARTHYAPLSIPDGWSRYVLQAARTGTRGVPTFLMMSLVVPGTAAGPGTLVTFVTGPASEWTPQPGEPIVVNGTHGTLREDRAVDGTATAAISIVVDAVAIDAHGNVDAGVLQELVAGVGPVTDAEWTQLVSEIGTP